VQDDGHVELAEKLANKQPLIAKLKRSLYGLKQSGRNWYDTLDLYFVHEMGISQSQFEAGIIFL
jgi:hypothetical protein